MGKLGRQLIEAVFRFRDKTARLLRQSGHFSAKVAPLNANQETT
jgi:hypothetical protein